MPPSRHKSAAAPQLVRAPRYPVDALLVDIGDVPASTELGDRRRKSRDFFWTSPVLNVC